jgi:hypothetical protein
MPDYGWEDVGIESLIGHVFTTITNEGDEIVFWHADGTSFKMYHSQDCCESVYIEDMCGELDWLVNTPILTAYESNSDNEIDMNGKEKEFPEKEDEKDSWKNDSETWTFYRISTIKGTVTLRWYGSSNGYYSESVYVVKSQEDKHKPVSKTLPASVAQAVAVAPVFTFQFPLISTVRRIKD